MAEEKKQYGTKVKDIALFTALAVIIILCLRTCGNTEKTVEVVQETADNVDTIKHEVKEVRKVTTRTEKKVDAVLEIMDSCCNCEKPKKIPTKPVKKPVVKKPETKPFVLPQVDTVVVEKKCEPETIVVVKEPDPIPEPEITPSEMVSIRCNRVFIEY